MDFNFRGVLSTSGKGKRTSDLSATLVRYGREEMTGNVERGRARTEVKGWSEVQWEGSWWKSWGRTGANAAAREVPVAQGINRDLYFPTTASDLRQYTLITHLHRQTSTTTDIHYAIIQQSEDTISRRFNLPNNPHQSNQSNATFLARKKRNQKHPTQLLKYHPNPPLHISHPKNDVPPSPKTPSPSHVPDPTSEPAHDVSSPARSSSGDDPEPASRAIATFHLQDCQRLRCEAIRFHSFGGKAFCFRDRGSFALSLWKLNFVLGICLGSCSSIDDRWMG